MGESYLDSENYMRYWRGNQKYYRDAREESENITVAYKNYRYAREGVHYSI